MGEHRLLIEVQPQADSAEIRAVIYERDFEFGDERLMEFYFVKDILAFTWNPEWPRWNQTRTLARRILKHVHGQVNFDTLELLNPRKHDVGKVTTDLGLIERLIKCELARNKIIEWNHD